MKGNTMNSFTSIWMPLLLGGVVAVIVFAGLSGKSLPLINSPKASLIALLVVGMAMCTGGIGQVGASGKWASPLAIIGILLGVLILVIIIAALAGFKLPVITGDIQAITAVGILIAIKFVIGTVGYFFHWL
jgi:hypothetical protein